MNYLPNFRHLPFVERYMAMRAPFMLGFSKKCFVVHYFVDKKLTRFSIKIQLSGQRPEMRSCLSQNHWLRQIEVRDSPHGIFGSCTRYPRGLTRWAELLGCRRRRRCRHLEIQVDIQARELYLEFVPMDLDSDETSRDIDTAVLHRISIPFIWAEWFCLRSHF